MCCISKYPFLPPGQDQLKFHLVTLDHDHAGHFSVSGLSGLRGQLATAAKVWSEDSSEHVGDVSLRVEAVNAEEGEL